MLFSQKTVLSTYPTLAVPPVSFLNIHPGEIQILWSSQTSEKREKPNVAEESRQANQVLAYPVREHEKKRHPRNKSYEKKKTTS